MVRRRFRQRRSNFRRARGFIRRTVSNMGPLEAKRVILDAVQIPARSAAAYDNPLTIGLLTCTETVDEELESDGTNIAQTTLYSKIAALKMQLMIHGLTAGDRVRWMLIKDIDNEGAPASLVDANFHGSNDTIDARELRAKTLAKGIHVGTDKTGSRLNLFVKRKTLHRLGSLRENDRIELVLAVSGTNVANITGFGTIYVRTN